MLTPTVCFADVVSAIATLRTSLEASRRELETSSKFKASAPDGDDFIEVMSTFLAQAGPEVGRVSRLQADLEAELKKLCAYFGEKEEIAVRPEQLFGTVAAFSTSLQKAAAEMTRHLVKPEAAIYNGTGPSTPTGPSLHLIGASDMSGTAPGLSLRSLEPVSIGMDGLFVPPTDNVPPIWASMSRAGGQPRGTVRGTVSRGELDEAIRTIHGGVRRRERREASTIGKGGMRLSKMFLDGGGGSVRGKHTTPHD